jgi:hypothetical protein
MTYADQPTDEEKEPKNEAEAVREKLSAIKKARDRRDKVKKDYRWTELINEYKGQFTFNVDIDIMPINLIFAYVKTELPSLYIRDPHIKVNPKNRTSINTAKVLEEVINYIWKYKKIKREVKKCVIDALLIGHSWVKLGYTGKFGSIEDEMGGYIDTIESEDIFAYHVNWEDITFNDDSMDPPYDSKWIAHSVWLDVDEVKSNPRYKNTDGLTASFEDEKDMPSESEESHKGKVRLHEVWNMEKQTVCTITEGVEKYLEEKKWPLQMRGLPFSMLKFNFSNDMAYGLSDVAMFEPQVLELIKVRSMALDHLKRYNRQLITTPNNINDDEMAKIKKGVTGTIALAEDPSKIMALPYPPLQTDIYAIEERIKEDQINVSGQSPQERGATQKTSTRTVGELNMMREGAVNRRSEKVDLVEDFVEDIATKLVALLQQFVTVPYYARIVGQDSPELQGAIKERASAQSQSSVTNKEGFTFTAEDIEGEFDLEPVSGSSTPLDKAELMKTLFQLVELGPKAGAMPGGPFMGTVAKLIAENMDVQELIMALDTEQQMQMAQKAEGKEREAEMKQLALSKQAAETQMDAENAATKQNKVLVEFLKMQKESKGIEAEAQSKIQAEQMEAQNEMAIAKRKAELEAQLETIKLQHELQMEEMRTRHELQMAQAKNEAEIAMMKKKQATAPKPKPESK